jgi:hypothetical protein
MKYFLIILIFSVSAFGQDAQFTPKNPQEILKLKNTFELKNDSIVNYSLIENDRKLLIIGKRAIQIWDVETAKLISEVPNKIAQNHDFRFRTIISPNGNFWVVFDKVYSEKPPLLIKSKKMGAAVYDLRTGNLIKVLEGETHDLYEVFWSDNEKTFVTRIIRNIRNREEEFCFLDGETFKYRNCFSVFNSDWRNNFKISKDGTKFFVEISKELQNSGINLGTQYFIEIWDAEKVRLIRRLKLGEKNYSFSEIFLSQNERFLAFGDFTFELAENNLPKFTDEKSIRGVTENGKYFIVNEKKGLQFYDFETNQPKYVIPKIKDDYRTNFLVGDKVLINQNLQRNCGRTEGFEIETGKKLWEIKLACYYQSSDCFFCSDKPNFNDSIGFLNDGKYFLSNSEKAVRIWDTFTGELIQILVSPNQKNENSKFDDKIKGEKKVWSKDRKFIYFQDANDKSILQYEPVKN